MVLETLEVFVRHILTVTPPLPESEQEEVRLLERARLKVFLL